MKVFIRMRSLTLMSHFGEMQFRESPLTVCPLDIVRQFITAACPSVHTCPGSHAQSPENIHTRDSIRFSGALWRLIVIKAGQAVNQCSDNEFDCLHGVLYELAGQ